MKLRENVVRFPSRAQIPKLPSVACHSVMSWPDVTGSAPKHVCFILQVCSLGLNVGMWHLHEADLGRSK